MSPPADAAADTLESRLRLKRVFLQAMIASLVTSALIAVGILLFGEFNQTTSRILGTLGVLAVHSGLALVCTVTLERRWWPILSRLGIILFAANFVVFVTIIWSTTSDSVIGREIATTLVLIGYYIVAIPPAGLRERGRWLPIAYGALVCGVLGFGMALIAIWPQEAENEWFARLTLVAAVFTCSFSHTCLLGFARAVSPNTWIVRATAVCIWILGAILSHGILVDDLTVFQARIAGAAGVLDACGSLMLVVLARLRRVQKLERLQTSEKELELICPRCMTRQVVHAGDSKCHECGLKFQIEIEEPRCARCGYLLWQLTERRCPECGQPF
jgi:hypothetical protein